MKIKSLIPKKIKYKPITAKPLKYLKIAVDKDGDGIPQFLDCNDNSAKESGILHDWITKQRLLQERKQMAKLDIEPLKEEQEHFDSELSKSETGIEHFKQQVEKRTERYRENIRTGLECTGKNIDRIAQRYTKRSESPKSDPRMQKPEVTRGVHYLIPARIACRKMYHDANTGEPSSIPKYKRDKYVPFKPYTTGYIFTPQQAPLPRYLLMRKLRRLILYLQETKQFEKLKELQEQLQGEQVGGE